MNKKEKRLFTKIIYETYHEILPRLFRIGKDDFMLNNIDVFFKYDKNEINHLLDKAIHPVDYDNSNSCICGLYKGEDMCIEIRLEGIAHIAFKNVEFYAEHNAKFSIEKAARSVLIPILIHELFHYNQKVDFTMPSQKKYIEKAEAMVYQKSLEFELKHYNDIVNYLECDPLFLTNYVDIENYDILFMKSNTDKIIKDNIGRMFPEIGYTPYEYTDSCNFLARYIFDSYCIRSDVSNFYDETIITTKKDIHKYVLEFIKNYEEAKEVKMEFDIKLGELYTVGYVAPELNDSRVSGYVLLKDNGKDLNEVKSIERLFNTLINKLDKSMGLNKKQLLKLNNEDLYKRIMTDSVKSGEILRISTILEYQIFNKTMIVSLRNINLSDRI